MYFLLLIFLLVIAQLALLVFPHFWFPILVLIFIVGGYLLKKIEKDVRYF